MVAMAKPWKHPNGTYYFRVAIPTDLQEKLGVQLRKFSLRTKDAREAKKRFIPALEVFQEEMDRLRGGFSLSRKQARALAGEWLRQALEDDSRRRDGGVIPEEEGGHILESPYETELDAMEAADEANAPLRVVREEVGEILRKHGLHVDPTSDEFQWLVNEIFWAKVRYYQVITKRAYGDWSASEDLDSYPPLTVAQVRRETTARLSRRHGGEYSLSKLLVAWKKENHPAPKTVLEYERAVRRFIEFHDDIAPGEVTKTMVRQFKDALLDCPVVLSGEQRNATLPQLVKTTREKPDVRRLSAGSINKHIGAISALLAYGGQNGFCGDDPNWSNPALGLKVKRRQNQTEKRLGYDPDDLQQIFRSPVFSRGERPKGGGGEAAKWLPLLALYTGARVEELGQLLVSDVGVEDEQHFIHINTLDEGKRVKTESSHRKVPLHPEVIRLGFLEYVEERRCSECQRVFPDLRPDRNGVLTGNWSKWWGRYAREHGITDKRKVFHSFRHTFKTACRAAGIPEEIHDALTGHSRGGVGQSYGEHGLPLSVLAPELARIRFPGLKIPDDKTVKHRVAQKATGSFRKNAQWRSE